MMASDMRRWHLASKKVVSNDTDGHAIKPSLKNILNCYHIHRNGIFHRDIKPENIMLSGYWKECLAKIKLICFSICTCKKKVKKNTDNLLHSKFISTYDKILSQDSKIVLVTYGTVEKI